MGVGIPTGGSVAISMTMTGVMTVAMPLIAEFQFTQEIEDRLLAPISVEGIAVEKRSSRFPRAYCWARISTSARSTWECSS